MEKSKVYAKHRYAQISPKKVAPILSLVRGKSAQDALRILKFNDTKAGLIAYKVLKSAVANAKHNLRLDEEGLFVSETWVDGGPMAKRGRATARGRYNPLLKRTSHVIFGLSSKGNK